MSIFEFMAIAFSLVLALTFSRGLSGLRSTLMRERRYWPHAAWVMIKLLNTVAFWWWLWAYRVLDEGQWNVAIFIFYLSIPAVFYLQIASLLGSNPQQVTNWREHYYAERIWFFGLNTLLSIQTFIVMSNVLAPAEPNYHGVAWMFLVLTYSITCMVTANRRVHAVVAAIGLLGILAFLFSMFEAPALVI